MKTTILILAAALLVAACGSSFGVPARSRSSGGYGGYGGRFKKPMALSVENASHSVWTDVALERMEDGERIALPGFDPLEPGASRGLGDVPGGTYAVTLDGFDSRDGLLRHVELTWTGGPLRITDRS